MLRSEAAFLLFNLAEAASWVGVLVFAFEQGGIAATGFVAMVLLLPAGAAAPLVAAVGDRFRRTRFVSIGYASQGAALGIVGVAMWLDVAAGWVYGLAAAAMVALTTGRPGHHSLLPDLARTPDELAAGNSVSSLAEGLGGIAGTLAATIVLGRSSVGTLFVLIGAGLIGGSLLSVRAGPARELPSDRRPMWSLVVDAVSGIGTLVRSAGPRLLLGLAAVTTLSWGVYDVLLVTAAFDTLALGEAGVGALHTVIGVGVLVGAAGSVALVGRATLAPALVGGALLMGLAVAVQGWDRVGVVVAGAAVAGIAITVLDVAGRTLLQRVVADEVLTRVFGVIESLWFVGFGVGAVLAVPLERWLGLPGAFLASGAVLPILSFAALPGLRRVDRRAVPPTRQLELLRRLTMLEALPRTDLERVAAQLDRLSVAAGGEVVRQGEVGDRFYVIEEGAFAVEVAGSEVRRLGPGDHFGEIALLHDVPRTATVRALEPGTVWALDQEEFLATVTGLPQVASEAHRVSAERLRATTPPTEP
jgi:hypothetical protein